MNYNRISIPNSQNPSKDLLQSIVGLANHEAWEEKNCL